MTTARSSSSNTERGTRARRQISAYEIYFQLLTTGQTYFEEVGGTDLGVGQSDIGQFEQYVGRDSVVAVEISDVFFDGPVALRMHPRRVHSGVRRGEHFFEFARLGQRNFVA